MTPRVVSRRHISRFPALACICIVACSAAAVSISAQDWSPDRFKGLSLGSALAKLQQDGLRLVFSSDLVQPGMIVSEEPRGRWPLEILDELLAPHGLRSKRGPSGSLLIVKAPSTGSIQGTVRLAGSREAVPGVHIVAVGTRVEASSKADGSFSAGPLPEGTYIFEVRRAGYLPQRLENVPVKAGAVTELRLELNPRNVSVEKIVVRAGDGASRGNQPELRESLGTSEMETSPEFGGDPLLPVARLPGVAATDGSGGLNIRGGSGREVKTILDGLELYEPYHLKERGGPISLIDSRNIGGLGLLGGAFPAEYGGHMSAVVEMDTVVPSDELETGVAVSSGDARIASQGALNDRLRWLVSGRRGDPSQLLDALGADPSYTPRYWDLFAKADYRLDDRTTLSLEFLGGDDDMEGGGDSDMAQTVEEPGTFRSHHTNRYAWITLKRALSGRIFSQTVLSSGHLNNDRYGSSPRVADVRDSRSTGIAGLKQNWLLQGSRHFFKWGVDVKRLQADYHYTSTPTITPSSSFGNAASLDPIAITTAPGGNDLGVYVADRFRVSPKLNVEFGLRWDIQTYTLKRDGTLSPRMNAIYTLGDRTTLRAGWGYFYQPQQIHELQVEDGVEEFFPAERAEHRLVSFEHELDGGFLLQLNAYQKLMTELHPRFENLFDPFGFFPEANGDRVTIAPETARAEGLELSLRSPATGRTGWWAGYGLARAEDEVDGRWVPRSWDHRHALDVGFRWKPGDRWDLTLAGNYHSGTPTTPVTAELHQLPDGSSQIVPSIGARNSHRLPAYHRIDARVSRSIPIRGTDLRTSLTVTNVLGRENTCCIAEFVYIPRADGTVTVERRTRHGLPRLLTFGVHWKF